MNSPDPFEERLARTPLRSPPASLREQVLHAARRSHPEMAPSPSSAVWAWIVQTLWPHPVAWGALGCAWITAISLQLAALEEARGVKPVPRVPAAASPAWTAALREQRALLHGLLQDMPSPALPPRFPPDAQLWPRPGPAGLVVV